MSGGWKVITAAIAISLIPVAGSAEGAPPAVARCNDPKTGLCIEYRNMGAKGLAAMKSSCEMKRNGSAWEDAKACATEKRVGHCSRKVIDAITVFNYYAPYDADKAKKQCADAMMEKFEAN
jgi:hypothetical protein